MGVYKAETTCSDDHRVTGHLMSMLVVLCLYGSIQGRDYLLGWPQGDQSLNVHVPGALHTWTCIQGRDYLLRWPTLVVLYRHVYKAETTCSDYHRVTGHSMSMYGSIQGRDDHMVTLCCLTDMSVYQIETECSVHKMTTNYAFAYNFLITF